MSAQHVQAMLAEVEDDQARHFIAAQLSYLMGRRSREAEARLLGTGRTEKVKASRAKYAAALRAKVETAYRR